MNTLTSISPLSIFVPSHEESVDIASKVREMSMFDLHAYIYTEEEFFDEEGHNITPFLLKEYIYRQDIERVRVFHRKVRAGDIKSVREFLINFPELVSKYDLGMLPLHAAVAVSQYDMTELLLRFTSPNSLTASGKSALDLASKPKIRELLILNGALEDTEEDITLPDPEPLSSEQVDLVSFYSQQILEQMSATRV